MNELIFMRDPFATIRDNMFKGLEVFMDMDLSHESKGLRKLIHRPHNLLTKKDDTGNVVSYGLQVVYTPFKKNEIKVEVLGSNLTVKCGLENKTRDDDMDFCGISHQSYEFTLPLAENIDCEKITANAEDGILYITLPVKQVKEQKDEPFVIEVQ